MQVATADTFEAVAREWFAKHSPTWAANHAEKIIQRLERDIFPWLGDAPIDTVTAPALLTVLRRIEDRGALETAHRAKQNCGQIFRYGVATGRCQRDPSSDLKGALPPFRRAHFASITDPPSVADLLRAVHGYRGAFVTRCALRLAPLVFVRPGELRHAEWSEVDLDGAEWRIPAERMKMKADHIVPLARQAMETLRDLHPLTGRGKYLFPQSSDPVKPMSDNTVRMALRRLGYSNEMMSGHGFRAMARTLLDEVLGFKVDLIEHQLAHAVRDPLGRAYNRTTHLPERRKMMQVWADYLDGLRGHSG